MFYRSIVSLMAPKRRSMAICCQVSVTSPAALLADVEGSLDDKKGLHRCELYMIQVLERLTMTETNPFWTMAPKLSTQRQMTLCGALDCLRDLVHAGVKISGYHNMWL